MTYNLFNNLIKYNELKEELESDSSIIKDINSLKPIIIEYNSIIGKLKKNINNTTFTDIYIDNIFNISNLKDVFMDTHHIDDLLFWNNNYINNIDINSISKINCIGIPSLFIIRKTKTTNTGKLFIMDYSDTRHNKFFNISSYINVCNKHLFNELYHNYNTNGNNVIYGLLTIENNNIYNEENIIYNIFNIKKINNLIFNQIYPILKDNNYKFVKTIPSSNTNNYITVIDNNIYKKYNIVKCNIDKINIIKTNNYYHDIILSVNINNYKKIDIKITNISILIYNLTNNNIIYLHIFDNKNVKLFNPYPKYQHMYSNIDLIFKILNINEEDYIISNNKLFYITDIYDYFINIILPKNKNKDVLTLLNMIDVFNNIEYNENNIIINNNSINSSSTNKILQQYIKIFNYLTGLIKI